MKKNIIAMAVTVVFIFCFLTIAEAQEVIRYHGSAPIGKLIMPGAAAEFEKQENIKFDIKYKTTGYGIKKLLARECDIAGGARPLEEAEKKRGLIETEICLDGYVFIVHESNPVKKIASEQIADIFRGKIKMWGELGGTEGEKITIISPPTEAAYYVTARKTIGFDKLPENSAQTDMTTDVYKAVKASRLSMGLASYADIADKKDIHTLEILHQGKHAKISQTHIYFGSYPYRQMLYFFTNGTPEGNIKKFTDFFKTKKGKRLIMDAGLFLLPQR